MMLIISLNVTQKGRFTQSLAIIWCLLDYVSKWTVLHPVTDKWGVSSLVAFFHVLHI